MPDSQKHSAGRPKQIPEYAEGEQAWNTFDDAMGKILSVSKEQILELEKQSKDKNRSSTQ